MNKLGVSNVIGVILMIGLVFVLSLYVSQNVLTATRSEIESVKELHTNIVLFQRDDKIYLQHKGGEQLEDYQVYINGELVVQGEDMVIGDIIEISIPSGDNDVHFTSDNTVLFDGIVEYEEPSPDPPIIPPGVVNMTFGTAQANIMVVQHNLSGIPSCIMVTSLYFGGICSVCDVNETCFRVMMTDHAGNDRNGMFYWLALK